MSIQLQCDACSAQYELDDEDAGQQVQCACGAVMTVPTSNASQKKKSAKSRKGAGNKKSSAKKSSNQNKIDTSQITSVPARCEACGAEYELEPEDAGEDAQCACGEIISVPTLQEVALKLQKAKAAAKKKSRTAPGKTAAGKVAGKANADSPFADLESSAPVSPTSSKKSKAKPQLSREEIRAKLEQAKAEKKEKKKAGGKGLLVGMGVGIAVLLAALIAVTWDDGTGEVVKKKEAEAPVAAPAVVVARDPLEFRSWISADCVGIVAINPERIIAAPAIKPLLNDEVYAAITNLSGVEVQKVEQIVVVLEPAALGLAGEDAEPANPLVFLKSKSSIKKEVLLLSVLGGPHEASSAGGHEFFTFGNQAAYFVDKQTAVFGGRAALAAALEGLSKAEPESPIFEQLKLISVGGEIVVLGSLTDYRDQLAGMSSMAGPMLPAGLAESLAKLDSIVLRVYASGSNLVRLSLDLDDEESAQKLETALQAGVKTATQLYSAGKEDLAKSMADAGQLATTSIDSVINKIAVRKSKNSVNVTVPFPSGMISLAESAAPAFAESVGVKKKVVAVAQNTGPADRKQEKNVTDLAAVLLPIPPADAATIRKFEDAAQGYEKFRDEVTKVDEEIKAAGEDKAKADALQRKRRRVLAQAVGYLELAERLALRDIERDYEMDQSVAYLTFVRFLLGYWYQEMGLVYRAAIVSEWVIKNSSDENQIKEATEFAFNAYNLAFEAAPPHDYQIELEGCTRAALRIEETLPQSDKLDGVRLAMGQRLMNDGQLEPAAMWFTRVSRKNEYFARANIIAGQTYYNLYQDLAKAHPKIKLHDAIDKPAEPSSTDPPAAPAGTPPATESTTAPITPTTESKPADGASTTVDDGSCQPEPEATKTDEAKPAEGAGQPVAPAGENAEGGAGEEEPPQFIDTPENRIRAKMQGYLHLSAKYLRIGIKTTEEQELAKIEAGKAGDEAKPKSDKKPKAGEGKKPKAQPKKEDEKPTDAKSDKDDEKEEPAEGKEVEEKEERPPVGSEFLIDSKRFLAHVEIVLGNYDKAIPILVKEPFSVVNALYFEEDQERPKKGFGSADYATSVYQLLLRAYVATKQPVLARQTMQTLESVSDQVDATKLTATYLSMGKQLLEELNAAPPARAAEIRDAFSSFLDEMAGRETQSFSSIYWIAETFLTLGDSVETTDADLAKQYFAKCAAAYQQIIDRGSSERGFAKPQTVSAIRIRLAKALRAAGKYEESVDVFRAILALREYSFDMQFEVAMTLEDWGTKTDEKDKLKQAALGIVVDGKRTSVWGWAGICSKLQQLIREGKDQPGYRERLLDARYHLASSRREFALAQTDEAEKKKLLEQAMQNLKVVGSLESDFTGWEQLDEIYQTLQKDLGQTPVSIKESAAIPPANE